MMSIDISEYKDKLLTKREKIVKKINSINNKKGSREGLNENWKESTGELSSYDNHPADIGSDTFERGKEIGMRDNAKLFLTMIDDALARIETGEYGNCDKCGAEISRERLEIMPSTTICYSCKKEMELDQKEKGRPVGEEAFLELHRNMYLNYDNSHDAGYDGLDTWYDLSKVGTSNTPSEKVNNNNPE